MLIFSSSLCRLTIVNILINGCCMKKKSILPASIALLLFSGIASAKSFVEYPSRYTRIDPQVTPSQNNILSYKRKRAFPHKSVSTVGQAMRIWLRGTGYSLAYMHPDQNVYQLLQLSLPNVHRTLGTVSIESGLKALAGDPWELVIDPVHRLVSFSLPAGYAQPMLATSSVIDVRRNSGSRYIQNTETPGSDTSIQYVERGAMIRSAAPAIPATTKRNNKRCFIFCKATSTLEFIH